ncbi:uncharacterized protein BX664DRAFT_383380 [Halteromyces radiatus]|uniref:uncharacterized protein n=1 Tax=Halteromyces radiatus TaxID=101107 RepID=UPI0022207D75|nr:uncharacterized protein BX664DRAFT_383380 [Halteromyces radiatus]KAI8097027.1 hypothetical protein BX664DRAFT_383380 [Halteromyces radiatus]
MPFRCKCGRTFEKPDSFSTHTSACASFHHRRMSDTAALFTQPTIHPHASSLPSIYTTPLTFNHAPVSPSSSSMASSPTNDIPQELSSSPPLWMPTGISIQNAFEGARRRSMSYGSSFK